MVISSSQGYLAPSPLYACFVILLILPVMLQKLQHCAFLQMWLTPWLRLLAWGWASQWPSLQRQVILVRSSQVILVSTKHSNNRTNYIWLAGEGLADLYGALQPILDGIVEERMANRVAMARPQGIDGQPEDAGPIKLAIIGQPNVVHARAASPVCKYSGAQDMEQCQSVSKGTAHTSGTEQGFLQSTVE